MNTFISSPWLGCVKFCPGSQGFRSLCGEQCPTFKQIKLWLLFLRFFQKFWSACLCSKRLPLEGAGAVAHFSDQKQSEQAKFGKIFAWQRRESEVWGLGKCELAGKAYLQAFKAIQLNPCSAPMLQTIIFPSTWYFKTHYMYLICLSSKRPSGRFASDLLCLYWGEAKQIIKPRIQPAIWMGSMHKKA